MVSFGSRHPLLHVFLFYGGVFAQLPRSSLRSVSRASFLRANIDRRRFGSNLRSSALDSFYQSTNFRRLQRAQRGVLTQLSAPPSPSGRSGGHGCNFQRRRRNLPLQGRGRDKAQEESETISDPELLEALRMVKVPFQALEDENDASKDLVTGGMVKESIGERNLGIASVLIELPLPVDLQTKRSLEEECGAAVKALDWVRNPLIVITAPEGTPKQRVSAIQGVPGEGAAPRSPFEGAPTELGPMRKGGLVNVSKIVAVSSCKGGVGKSTTSVNLAFALKSQGYRVGIVDTDLYGPSLPTMVVPDSYDVELKEGSNDIIPLEAHGVKLMSMGFINPSDSMMVRGARAAPLVEQLLSRTQWGELDYLVIDMPPGTGDIQLTLSQSVSIDGAVIVTTPQRLSFADVVKGVEMFDKVGIPCIAVVENMAYWQNTELGSKIDEIAESHGLSDTVREELHAATSKPQYIFGPGHRQRLSEMWGIENTYALPLDPQLSASGDSGTPYIMHHDQTGPGKQYEQLAKDVVSELSRSDALRQSKPSVSYDAIQNLIVSQLADGTVQSITPVELRRRCRSPTNVQELITEDVKPLQLFPLGNYAIQVVWNDGHQSLMPYASFIEGYRTSNPSVLSSPDSIKGDAGDGDQSTTESSSTSTSGSSARPAIPQQ